MMLSGAAILSLVVIREEKSRNKKQREKSRMLRVGW